MTGRVERGGEGPVGARYAARIAAGLLEPDPAQADAVRRLDAIAAALAASQGGRGGLLGYLRGAKPSQVGLRGLYLHGGVGRGKTMLMDLFFDAVPLAAKLRRHFHEFMAETHEAIGLARKSVPGDPIPHVAADMAKATRLLCFDELHVTDIADAMILGRLFKGLFASGVVVVATSNAHPEDLYRNGLNRQLFLPFIDLIEDHMDILELKAARDFRLERLVGRPLYFTPADAASSRALDAIWTGLTATPADGGEPQRLAVKGRTVEVPKAALGVARFSFADLCDRPLGAADYLRIAREYHTVMIDGIPVLPPARRNEARRFINLIDALYDNRVGLVVSADAQPDELYPAGDEAALFQRTASRLMEMRTEAYLLSRTERGGRTDGAL
ncbi:MAG: cell division protein ZapE [Hyphomicrobiaceae bacterium]|nr:cell division protein ZapE [Hyphomicrobiaceae bacterium]